MKLHAVEGVMFARDKSPCDGCGKPTHFDLRYDVYVILTLFGGKTCMKCVPANERAPITLNLDTKKFYFYGVEQ